MRSTSAIQKCDQEVRLTSAIDRCDSQVRSTGATHKCDRLNREFKSLQVCKFEKARKFASSQVCAQKTQKIQKSLLNESRQFDNECSTINWCLRVVGTLRLLIRYVFNQNTNCSLLLPDDGSNTQRGNQDNTIQQSNKSWKILTGRPSQGF